MHPVHLASPAEPPAKDTAKLRPCLRCRAMFHSAWAGERICSRCKSTVVWRNGAPPQSHSTVSRR